MSYQQYVTNATKKTAIVTGNTIQNALFFPNTAVSGSTLNILAAATILDGFLSDAQSTTNPTTAFCSSVTFTLNNPLYTDDDSDLIEFQVCLSSTGSTGTTANANQQFQIMCKLSNLGTVAVTPIYVATSNSNGIISIFVNKWFLMKSPGSTYCFTLMGLSNTTASA